MDAEYTFVHVFYQMDKHDRIMKQHPAELEIEMEKRKTIPKYIREKVRLTEELDELNFFGTHFSPINKFTYDEVLDELEDEESKGLHDDYSFLKGVFLLNFVKTEEKNNIYQFILI